MMHLAFVVLSLALGLSSGARIGMDEEVKDLGNRNFNLTNRNDFNLTAWLSEFNFNLTSGAELGPIDFGGRVEHGQGEKGDCDKNDFKGSQGCLCGESQSLYQFNSVHSGGKKEDREWTLGCQYIPGYSEAKPFKNDDYVETSYGGIYQTQFHNLGCFLWNGKAWMGSRPSRPAPTECGLSLSPDCFMWNGKGWKGPAPSQPAPTECGLKTCLPCSSSEACLPCKSGEGYIVGMESKFYHNNWLHNYNDRQYKFTYQKSDHLRLLDCSWSNWLNDYDKEVRKTLLPNQVLAGVWSEYSKKHRDRRFRINVCKLVPKCSVLKEIKYDMTKLEELENREVEAGIISIKDQLKHPNSAEMWCTIASSKSNSLAESYSFTKTSGHDMTASLELSVSGGWGPVEVGITAGFSTTWSTEKSWTRSGSHSLTAANGYQIKYIDTCPGGKYCKSVVILETGLAEIPYEIHAYTEDDKDEVCIEYGKMKVRHNKHVTSRIESRDVMF